MIINTFNHENFKPEFEELKMEACGIVTIHSKNGCWEPEATMTFAEDGCHNREYKTISGETFNVMYLPHADSTDLYFLQPQTVNTVLIPLPIDMFVVGSLNWMTNRESGTGIDIVQWNEDDKRPLVEIQ